MTVLSKTSEGRRADGWAAGALFGLLGLAAVIGAGLYLAGRPVHATAAPITALWLPHAGPGTLPALVVAAAVVRYGFRLAASLPWPRLLAAGYAAAVAWTLSLALIDGWRRGVAGRLTTSHEYLSEVPGVADVPAMLRGFAGRIVDGQPDSWTTHVSGHPPGAFLLFVGLDRAGLGGGAWAAVVCVAVAGLGAVGVPLALRALGDEDAARAAVPFLVLFPGAVWQGVSADGLFTGVVAVGLALLAVGLTARRPAFGLAAGLLLGYALYMSYGFTLLVILAGAIVLLSRRIGRPPVSVLVAAGAGAGLVVATFTGAGFWWFDGMRLVTVRYYQGIAAVRPYAYWIGANLATVALSAGPVAAVTVRRAAAVTVRRAAAVTVRRAAAVTVRRAVAASGKRLSPAVVLPLAALLTLLAADLSGYSKAEVERIWQPFVIWFMAGAALIPARHRRSWLVAQAAIALLTNHLLLTSW